MNQEISITINGGSEFRGAHLIREAIVGDQGVEGYTMKALMPKGFDYEVTAGDSVAVLDDYKRVFTVLGTSFEETDSEFFVVLHLTQDDRNGSPVDYRELIEDALAKNTIIPLKVARKHWEGNAGNEAMLTNIRHTFQDIAQGAPGIHKQTLPVSVYFTIILLLRGLDTDDKAILAVDNFIKILRSVPNLKMSFRNTDISYKDVGGDYQGTTKIVFSFIGE